MPVIDANVDPTGYSPIQELGFDAAHYKLWGGENGFSAILDKATNKRLHDQHYKREFTDKGIPLPGYLRIAMGGDVSQEMAELENYYSKPKKH